MNGFLIDNQIILGSGSIDYFLFSEKFEPSIEELIKGEIRADWEDEEDDKEIEEVMGFTPDENINNSLSSPIKIEFSIKLELSINGKQIDFQIGSLGEDSVNASINKGEKARPIDYAPNEFGGAVLRI